MRCPFSKSSITFSLQILFIFSFPSSTVFPLKDLLCHFSLSRALLQFFLSRINNLCYQIISSSNLSLLLFPLQFFFDIFSSFFKLRSSLLYSTLSLHCFFLYILSLLFFFSSLSLFLLEVFSIILLPTVFSFALFFLFIITSSIISNCASYYF